MWPPGTSCSIGTGIGCDRCWPSGSIRDSQPAWIRPTWSRRLWPRPTGGLTPTSASRRREQSAGLRTALAKLSETDREVLVLRHLEQMPPREIAAVLGISEGAVYTRHLRALDRLRRLMTATGDQP